jgi:glutathione S-transferase
MLTSSSTLHPLHLHAFPTSPNPAKIAMALEFLSVPYTLQMWDFGSDPDRGVKGAKFAPFSENGRVPVLEDPNTGVTAWESGACMNYLKRTYDPSGEKLGIERFFDVDDVDLGRKEQLRVDLEKWELLLLTTTAPMSGQLVWYR